MDDSGLDTAEYEIRLKKYGPNKYAKEDTINTAVTVCRDQRWKQTMTVDLVPGLFFFKKKRKLKTKEFSTLLTFFFFFWSFFLSLFSFF